MSQPASDASLTPLPADWTVREGRDAYLAENGFSIESYDEAFTPATVFGLRLRVPNTPRHRWAIRLHDLHHVATGFGTDFVGEAEVSAWESAGRLRPLGLYTAGIVLGLALAGLCVAPQRTRRAYRASRRASLFGPDPPDYEALLALSIGELRQRLGIPAAGLADAPRALHPRAPAPGSDAATPVCASEDA
jgi:hypothetical protein